MKNIRNYTHLLLFVVTCLAVLGACTKEEHLLPVTYSSYMKGAVTPNLHDYSVRGSTLLFTAGGVTTPTEDELSYLWTISDASTTTVASGQILKYTCTDIGSSFTVTLNASAYDYYATSAVKAVTLIEGTYVGTVHGIEHASSFTDVRDNQPYQYKHIGGYDWMTQNLNWDGTLADGTGASSVGKKYKDQKEYGIIYGSLYSWDEAASTAKPICPDGWRLPTNTEWEDLGTTLNDGTAVSFASQWNKLGSFAKAANASINGGRLWPYNPDDSNANTQNWNGLPAGKASGDASSPTFSDNGRYAYWWSATPYNTTDAYYRYIVYNNSLFYFNYGDKDGLYLSVRCVR